MRKSAGLILLLVAVVATAQLSIPPQPALADVEVITDSTTNQFPGGIRFDFFFSSDATVTDVRLRFRIKPDGVNATVRPDCTEGRVMNCQATVGNVGATYMVPGAEIVYSWQVTDADGNRFQSDEMTVVYEDTRFDWSSINEGNLTVYYYFGDESSVRAVLNTATETIDRFSGILGATIDFPIKIWVYQTAQDMQPAVASRRGQGNDNSIVTLGEVGASDTALVSTDTEFLDIVRHELTHVVTGAATASHLVDIPIWLNEGLSTYAQKQLLPNENNALTNAIQRNTVLPITSLGASARGSGNAVSLFYAESGSIVAFMIEKLGEEKFGQFITALKDDTTDGALEKIYGLDLLGLENAWREAVGLPEVDLSNPTPTSAPSQNVQPTATPRTSQSQPSGSDGSNNNGRPASSSNTSDGGGVSTVVIVLGVMIGAFVLLLGAAGVLMMKGRGAAG